MQGLNGIGDLDQLAGGGLRIGIGSGGSEFHLASKVSRRRWNVEPKDGKRDQQQYHPWSDRLAMFCELPVGVMYRQTHLPNLEAFTETPSRIAILRTVAGGRFIRFAMVSRDFPDPASSFNRRSSAKDQRVVAFAIPSSF
jgi:hypothetical protein